MFGGAYVVDNYALRVEGVLHPRRVRHHPALGRLHRRGRLLPGRVLLPAPGLDVRHDGDGVGARPDHAVRRAGDDLDPDVRARRVPQARPALERSGREVLLDRRAVVGVDALRHVADLRRDRQRRSWSAISAYFTATARAPCSRSRSSCRSSGSRSRSARCRSTSGRPTPTRARPLPSPRSCRLRRRRAVSSRSINIIYFGFYGATASESVVAGGVGARGRSR